MQLVKVRIRKPTRVADYICGEEITLNRWEPCVVQSERGAEYGICVQAPRVCENGDASGIEQSVVRKATEEDTESMRRLRDDEKRALEICAAKVRQHGLPMKLIDAEYTLDKQRILVYFTAADRVDFRKLVRDLAQDLKTRIELRHIQVRDEAKLVGGVGLCGRELCCASWLSDFLPISMKMAKRQNLSLNPSKISGQCGRLLCCLGYENEMYPSGMASTRTAPLPLEDAHDFVEPATVPPLPEPPANRERKPREAACPLEPRSVFAAPPPIADDEEVDDNDESGAVERELAPDGSVINADQTVARRRSKRRPRGRKRGGRGA